MTEDPVWLQSVLEFIASQEHCTIEEARARYETRVAATCVTVDDPSPGLPSVDLGLDLDPDLGRAEADRSRRWLPKLYSTTAIPTETVFQRREVKFFGSAVGQDLPNAPGVYNSFAETNIYEAERAPTGLPFAVDEFMLTSPSKALIACVMEAAFIASFLNTEIVYGVVADLFTLDWEDSRAVPWRARWRPYENLLLPGNCDFAFKLRWGPLAQVYDGPDTYLRLTLNNGIGSGVET